jgi:hypothetical protein
MKTNKLIIISGMLLLSLTVASCNPLQPGNQEVNHNDQVIISSPTAESIPATEEVQPTAETSEEANSGATQLVQFDQLGISLEVPQELYVQKDPQTNYDNASVLDSYLFYIQNYGQPGGPPSGNFQMYGHLQYNLPNISWEEFAQIQTDSPMNDYANEIEINGVRGFDTQVAGQRNRFVYHFYLNGQILSIAVADPSEENKVIADQIISTLRFDPAQFTNQSGVVRILEPNFYYQMLLPADWNYSFSPPIGIRLSDLQANSADNVVEIEDSDGPHSNIYHKSGISLSFVILDDNSAQSDPPAAVISNQYEFMFSGIVMTDYRFVEPSTAEGELREIRFFHEGRSYLLRFSSAPGTDQELIDWMIRNLEISVSD